MKSLKDRASGLKEAIALREQEGMQTRLGFLTGVVLFSALLLGSCTKQGPGIAFTPQTDNLEIQKFVIQASSDEVVAGKQGSIFAIPANAFLDAQGKPVTGEVEIHLREANTTKDILAGGLITQTGDKLLASDGMYKIEAFQGGSSLQLNPETGIYAYLPNDGRDPKMNLYEGQMSEDKLDWKLSDKGEESLLDPNDPSVSKECKKCERLLKMVDRVKPGKKPKGDDYYAKRHYWQNGMLYFYSSGSAKPIVNEKTLEECRDYLERSSKGRQLLAQVNKIKQEQLAGAASYYTYRITTLGWYNCDKLVPEELITFKGKVTDEDGNPVAGAKVHLLSTDPDMRIHTATTATNGNYEMQFIPGRKVRIYAFHESFAGRRDVSVEHDGQEMSPVAMSQVASVEEMDEFLADLN